jgi:hypothetical protein
MRFKIIGFLDHFFQFKSRDVGSLSETNGVKLEDAITRKTALAYLHFLHQILRDLMPAAYYDYLKVMALIFPTIRMLMSSIVELFHRKFKEVVRNFKQYLLYLSL